MRTFGIGALAGGLILATAHALNLAAVAYSRVVEAHLDLPRSQRVQQAAAFASSAAPWSSHHLALAGWIAIENRRAPEALGDYTDALRWAPAEALLWSEYALALARANHFDSQLAHAIERAGSQAPTSGAVQQAIAELGLSYWRDGDDRLRALWLAGMRYELGHDREGFLGSALARGHAGSFCGQPAAALGEERWCESVAGALLGECFTIEGSRALPCVGG